MAEINNLQQNDPEEEMENLENLSPKELQGRIQEEKKNARRSLRLAFTALLAIIAVCMAWFASSKQVTVKDIQTSARDDAPFDIASTGNRQTGEQDYFRDENGSTILSEGIEKHYDEYIDVESGNPGSTGRTYYVGGSGIAWHMNGDQSLIPGAGGKLEFYIIPKQTGLTSVTVKLNMEGYTLNEKTQKVEKLENPKIQNLLNGHILLFRYLDDQYGYYGWLGEDHTLTINAPTRPEGNTFVPNIPYKVTLYWKWPQYFRNYIYTQRSTYGDLFTDEMVTKYGEEYNSLVQFVNDQKSITGNTGALFYDTGGNGTLISEHIDKNMSDTTLDTCSTYYNQADEYIGTNTQYVYIQIELN